MNLLHETAEAIARSGHTPSDIVFIGSLESGHSCTWEEFAKLADIEYDDGFGAQKVATDLVIVFADGQKMWRGEYDGSEWWEFSTPSVIPADQKRVVRLVVDGIGWRTLKELNP